MPLTYTKRSNLLKQLIQRFTQQNITKGYSVEICVLSAKIFDKYEFLKCFCDQIPTFYRCFCIENYVFVHLYIEFTMLWLKSKYNKIKDSKQ